MTGFDERAGAPTRPHQLSNPTYGPDQIKLLGEAFDAAWKHIDPGAGARPQSIEAARLKLAETILSLAACGALDADELKKSALKRMFADPLKL
jgi:hypothetical protein